MMIVVTSDSARVRAQRQRRIAERYARGDLITQIALEEGVDRKTVRNIARREGLPLRHPRQTERNNRIVSRCRDGEQIVQIAKEEGVQSSYVSDLARNAGLPPRRDWQRRYPITEGVFDAPDATGWWLIGLIAADGSIHEAEHRVSLAQRGEDADVLHAFFEYVGCPGRPLTKLRWRTRPGWTRSEGEYFEARIFSRQICAALARHGVVPRKSTSLALSEEAAAQAAVWLGLFDGDGSAGARRHGGTPRIDFFGTPQVMKQCSEFWGGVLELQTGQCPTVAAHAGGLSVVRLYGSNAARAARIMLSASPVSLQRKRQTLEEIAGYGARRTRFGEPDAPARYRNSR